MIISSPVEIRKANGERELFNPEKLRESLVNSGADESVAQRVTERIGSMLRDGDRTQDIYTRAFTMLRTITRSSAARYSLKRALLELGPSGYPFENFVAEIFRVLGYTPTTRVTMSGKCVTHEMDMLAVRDNERLAAEIKYHNSAGTRSDIKVALYVQARFEDLDAGHRAHDMPRITKRMLITSTKFTEQARTYALCVGLDLLSWDYPRVGNLRHLIEETGVHPISCLTTLSSAHKRRLMESGIVLCQQIPDEAHHLVSLGLSEETRRAILDEVKDLCIPQK
jgi:hypothetical protein